MFDITEWRSHNRSDIPFPVAKKFADGEGGGVRSSFPTAGRGVPAPSAQRAVLQNRGKGVGARENQG